jgi:hypothetical protein
MESEEEWYAILDKIIFLLKQSNEDEPLEEKNDLAEWYEEYLETSPLTQTKVDGMTCYSRRKDDPETKEKVSRYYAREAELEDIRKQKRKEAFELLAQYFGHLWW